MEDHGFDTKTEAVNFALRELDRRKKLRAYKDTGLGLTPSELKNAFYEVCSPDAIMAVQAPAPYTPSKNNKK